MKKQRFFSKPIQIGVAMCFALTGLSCSHTEKQQPKSAKAFYETALQQKQSKNYTDALETLRNLRKKFFYSAVSAKGRLLMGDIYFETGDFRPAENEYKMFLKIHPESEEGTAHALYYLSLSYMKRLPDTADRDISVSDKALKYLHQLTGLKNSGPYQTKAKARIQSLLNLKAEKEFKTAVFYHRTGRLKASMKRARRILSAYPKSPLIARVLFLAYQMSEGERASEFKNRLLRDFPQSRPAKRLKKQSI